MALAVYEVGARMAENEHLYRRRAFTRLLLDMFESEAEGRMVQSDRDGHKVTNVMPHHELVQRVDFSPVLDAYSSLTAGERVIWLAMACGIARHGLAVWRQRTHAANGRPQPYSDVEVHTHYGISYPTIHRMWGQSQNRMDRAFRQIEGYFAERD